MKIREILKDFKFYCEYPKDSYSIYYAKFNNENYGFLVRFKNISSIKDIILKGKIEKPYYFKAINMKFVYKNQENQYTILKREYFSEYTPERLKEDEEKIKDIVTNTSGLEARKNLDLKLTDIEETDLPESVKRLKNYVLEKDMYFNVVLEENDKFSLNLIYDKNNLYYRIYPKLQDTSVKGLDYYKVNDRTYFIAPVRENSFNKIKKLIKEGS